jgi:signal peptidase I
VSQTPDLSAERGRQERTWLRDAGEVLVIAVILYLVIWTCIQTVKVDGTSMVNTLQNGDLLIASKISYRLGSPERGDIVILTPPPYCDGNPCPGVETKDFIKRVIGLPGDKVEIAGNTQQPGAHPTWLLIEPGGSGPWTRVQEPYLPDSWTVNAFCCGPDGKKLDNTQAGAVFSIPDGMYFVLGDNRNESNDSRIFGLVPKNKIEAKAILRIWPFGHFGSLGSAMTLVTIPALPTSFVVLLRRNRRRIRREIEVAVAQREGS